jgi:adenosylcobinamide-GDP ribazoletransferase
MLKRLVCAIAFLTRAPLPARLAFTAEDVGRASACFPLVGGLLGLLAVAERHLLGERLPPAVVAVIILATLALATGALHLDGLADMADGFGGGRTREDVLRIMRDHVIGAYGACALMFAVAVQVAALTTLLAIDGSDPVLVLAPLLARWPGVVVGFVVPYARTDGGLGRAVAGHAGLVEASAATATAVAAAFLLAGLDGLVLCAAVAVASAVLARWCVRRIGGVTGDTLGAIVVVAETLVYVVAVASR